MGYLNLAKSLCIIYNSEKETRINKYLTTGTDKIKKQKILFCEYSTLTVAINIAHYWQSFPLVSSGSSFFAQLLNVGSPCLG